jgi:hypothetical protein
MEQQMEITIRLKNNYGQQVAYPACKQSELFATIADTKTLTGRTLKLIEAMGYQINVKQQTAELEQIV